MILKTETNQLIASMVIAGVTIGLLASAYLLVFKTARKSLQKLDQPVMLNDLHHQSREFKA